MAICRDLYLQSAFFKGTLTQKIHFYLVFLSCPVCAGNKGSILNHGSSATEKLLLKTSPLVGILYLQHVLNIERCCKVVVARHDMKKKNKLFSCYSLSEDLEDQFFFIISVIYIIIIVFVQGGSTTPNPSSS
jgi:hypothetical protein